MISLYKVLGWINVGILIVIVSPFIAKQLSNDNKSLFCSIYKALRKTHKPLGIVLLFTISLHGTLALGPFALHTGTVLGIIILIAVMTGVNFTIIKNKQVFETHRILAYTTFIVLLLHVLFPSILS